jgi:hypothetical protein
MKWGIDNQQARAKARDVIARAAPRSTPASAAAEPLSGLLWGLTGSSGATGRGDLLPGLMDGS